MSQLLALLKSKIFVPQHLRHLNAATNTPKSVMSFARGLGGLGGFRDVAPHRWRMLGTAVASAFLLSVTPFWGEAHVDGHKAQAQSRQEQTSSQENLVPVKHRDWYAVQDPQKDPSKRNCYAYTEPLEAKGSYNRRGRIVFFVSHYDKDADQFQIGIAMGYPISTQFPIILTIDGKPFNLAVHSDLPENAFALPEEEKNIVAAMRAGYAMTVVGHSTRGTETQDEYSLLGLSRALNDVINCAR